jgi:hypothetical protein
MRSNIGKSDRANGLIKADWEDFGDVYLQVRLGIMVIVNLLTGPFSFFSGYKFLGLNTSPHKSVQ